MQAYSSELIEKSTKTLLKEFFQSLVPSKYEFSRERIRYFDLVIRESLASGISLSTANFDKIIDSAYKSGISSLTENELIQELYRIVEIHYNR